MTVLRIIGQRKWMIVGCVVLFTIITFVVTVLWRRYAPEYTAMAQLGISPQQQSPYDTANTEFAEVHLPGLKAAHAQLIKREDVLIQAMKSPEVIRTDWYQKDREGAVERITDILSVFPYPDANLIAILITDVAPREQDRFDLAEITNAVARVYVDDVRTRASRGRANHISRLRGKLAILQEQLDSIRAEIKRKKLPVMPIIHERIRTQCARLQALEGRVVELKLAKTRAEDALKDLDKHAKSGILSKMPEVRDMVEKDPYIKALRARELTLRSKRARLLEEVGPKDSSVVAIDTSLAAVRMQLAQAIKESAHVQAKALKEQLLLRLEMITAQLLNILEQIVKIWDTVEVDQ